MVGINILSGQTASLLNIKIEIAQHSFFHYICHCHWVLPLPSPPMITVIAPPCSTKTTAMLTLFSSYHQWCRRPQGFYLIVNWPRKITSKLIVFVLVFYPFPTRSPQNNSITLPPAAIIWGNGKCCHGKRGQSQWSVEWICSSFILLYFVFCAIVALKHWQN